MTSSTVDDKPVKGQQNDIEKLLSFGRFQFLVFCCFQTIVIVQGCNMLFMVFGKANPNKWDCLDEPSDDYVSMFNITNASSGCDLMIERTCQNFTSVSVFYSIVPEWQLVCDRVKYIYLIMTCQMAGAAIGSSLFGQLSDSFGRKWSLFAASGLLTGCSVISTFSPNWQTFAALRFLAGIFAGGCIVVNQVFIMEFLSIKHRLWFTNVTGWALAYFVQVLVAYLTGHWKKMTIVTNVIGLPALVLILMVGESPRWLMQSGQFEAAKKQLRRIARLNRVKNYEQLIEDLISENQKKLNDIERTEKAPRIRYTYWHLFSSAKLTRAIVVLSTTYFSVSVISSSIVYSVDRLSGSMYTNFAIMSALRWISNLATVGADLMFKRFGRKVGEVVPFLIIAVCSLGVVIVNLTGSHLANYNQIVNIVSMVISFVCPPLWIMTYLSNAELFPTPIRNMALAFCGTFNRLGGVIAPQILYLGDGVWDGAPFVFFTALSLLSAILFGLFVPETKGKPLPDHMPEAKRILQPPVLSVQHEKKLYQPVRADDEIKV